VTRFRPFKGRQISSFAAGVIGLVLIVVVVFFVVTRANPFSHPYKMSALFSNVENLQRGSEVRTAGVVIGKVKSIEVVTDGSGAALVKMEINDNGLPIHRDAQLQIRPRIFLEGNYFVDLKPGSPSAQTVKSGSTLPIQQTASSVSFGDILKVLDSNTRADLQTLLAEYSKALDKGGAEAFRQSTKFWPGAYRNTAIASDALLGENPSTDIPQLLRGQQRTFAALVRNPQDLADLITNLNRTARAFASEDQALAASVPALRDVLRVGYPTLATVNNALPSLARFARNARAPVRSIGPAVDAATPFITQLAKLVSEPELRGASRELRATVPPLVSLNHDLEPFLSQGRTLSSCASNVLVPWANTPIPDPNFPDSNNQPFFKEAPRALVGLSGESRTGDANGQWFRVLVGGGPNTIVERPPTGPPLFAQALFPSLGTQPTVPASKPQFRPDVPCETQQPADMSADTGPGDPTSSGGPGSGLLPLSAKQRRDMNALKEALAKDLGGGK
jgi:phospholipid/cholesterol/gamma-HCH transport system substrate-binding protein